MKEIPIDNDPIHVKRVPMVNKISDFVESLESHTIYDHNELAAAFEKEVGGLKAKWATETVAAVRKAIRKRGIGGQIPTGIPKRLTTCGTYVAEWCAKKFVPAADFTCLNRLLGLGSRYNEALRIIKDAGL